MALIDKLVGKIVREGHLTLVMPDGKRRIFGPGGGKSVTVRLMDRRTALGLAGMYGLVWVFTLLVQLKNMVSPGYGRR